jgi:hypothetical protein
MEAAVMTAMFFALRDLSSSHAFRCDIYRGRYSGMAAALSAKKNHLSYDAVDS